MDLRELWDRGRHAWPEIELSEERLSELLRNLPAADAGEAAELFLACGWVDGMASAGQVMARDYLPPLRRRLARMGLAASEIDEVVQQTCERLIGRDAEGRARLVKYAGQGRLQSLLVVVGTRIAIDSFRKADREQPDYDALAALAAAPASDPRAELLRAQKQAIFKAAVETALEALEPRERTVLRMHLIDGLTLDKIGDYYKVHRVTVSRWLAASRVSIIERARAAAQAQFGLSDTEFDAAYTGSQLGLSLERLLGD
jgi:RNA polymerase sigma-70 factor (ECF subfamily)